MTIYSRNVEIINVYDHILNLLKKSGAAKASFIMQGMKSGAFDTKEFFSILDTIASIGKIKCINKGVAGQDEVYVIGDN